MANNEQLDRIEAKLDELLEQVGALTKILVRSKTAAKQMGLNKDTLTRNKKISKYEEVGHRRTYVEIGEVGVIRKRERKR
jgi:hypothetical protein